MGDWQPDDSDVNGRMDEENRIRGVAEEGEEEFEETSDLDDEEDEDAGSTTF